MNRESRNSAIGVVRSIGSSFRERKVLLLRNRATIPETWCAVKGGKDR
jgi:hypothetical protein